MFGIKKLKVLTLSVITSSIFFTSCSTPDQLGSKTITGKTQGTTYTLIIVDEDVAISKSEIDSILLGFDNSLSTYVPSSVISQINSAEDSINIADQSGYFKECYLKSQSIFEKTEGAFDPSVYPLIEGWGFMKHVETPLDSNQVDSLLQFVSFTPNTLHRIEFSDSISVLKRSNGFKLDFNAIAQGLSVDILDRFLKSKGYENYYVEIGGELIVRGKNREGKDWRIGIDSPIENPTTREIENILNVSNKAVATSGNYRNFYEKSGEKYSHTLNPKTGWPVKHRLLSVTVIAENCADADGYATSFMVMGMEKTLSLVDSNNEGIEVYLIYTDDEGEIQRDFSDGFDKYFD